MTIQTQNSPAARSGDEPVSAAALARTVNASVTEESQRQHALEVLRPAPDGRGVDPYNTANRLSILNHPSA